MRAPKLFWLQAAEEIALGLNKGSCNGQISSQENICTLFYWRTTRQLNPGSQVVCSMAYVLKKFIKGYPRQHSKPYRHEVVIIIFSETSHVVGDYQNLHKLVFLCHVNNSLNLEHTHHYIAFVPEWLSDFREQFLSVGRINILHLKTLWNSAL